jgi:hypothetical protein
LVLEVGMQPATAPLEYRYVDAVVDASLDTLTPARWRLVTRIAFRFVVAYFTFYIISTQMISGLLVIPGVGVPPLASVPPLLTLTSWVATEVFGFPKPLVLISGSGDKPFDWTLVACLLVIAAGITAMWSVLDRRRPSYPGLQKWFRLFLRFGLGSTMLTYGMIKAFPLQMSYPSLIRLLEPYGHFSLMAVLWAHMGSSPAYQTFTGIIEVTAAILLFIPGLTVLGALISLAAGTHVFVLNMTYDTPVKLFSFHLIMMSLVLLAPDMKRLFNVVVLGRAVGKPSHPPLFRNRILRSLAIASQLGLGAWLVFSAFNADLQSWRRRGPNAPKPPLYGVWTIDTMTIDGQTRSPLVTDYDRWRRMVVQTAASVFFQRMDDTFLGYGAKVDTTAKVITLLGAPSTPSPVPPPGPPAEAGRLTYEQPTPGRLILDGTIDGKAIHMELQNYDRSNFRLVQSRFRWIQDYPFNR